jgi:DNA protecting protein DprA
LSSSKKNLLLDVLLKNCFSFPHTDSREDSNFLWKENDAALVTALISEAEENFTRRNWLHNVHSKHLQEIVTLPEWIHLYGKHLHVGCPLALHMRGPFPKDKRRSVAIIGSRFPTKAGREAAVSFSIAAVKSGYFVWSGGAIGIDTCALKGGLSAFENYEQHCKQHFAGVGAVLGSGLNVPYPQSNRLLFQNSALTLVSEFEANRPAFPYQFPMRNFTLAWLADYVLVVESKRNSGSIITANCAAALGKGVGALSWPKDHALSEGNNLLLESGAHKITTFDDIKRLWNE